MEFSGKNHRVRDCRLPLLIFAVVFLAATPSWGSLILDFRSTGTSFSTPDSRTLTGTFTDPNPDPDQGGDFIFTLTASAPTFFGTAWELNRTATGLGIDTTADSVGNVFANAENANEIDNLEVLQVSIQSINPEREIQVGVINPTSSGGGITFSQPVPTNSVFFEIAGGSLGDQLVTMEISVVPEPSAGLIALGLGLLFFTGMKIRRKRAIVAET